MDSRLVGLLEMVLVGSSVFCMKLRDGVLFD